VQNLHAETEPSPRSERLGTPKVPAIRFARGRLNGWPMHPLPTLRPHPRECKRTARAEVGRYAVLVVDSHHLLLAGLRRTQIKLRLSHLGYEEATRQAAPAQQPQWRPLEDLSDRGWRDQRRNAVERSFCRLKHASLPATPSSPETSSISSLAGLLAVIN
jgi:hypothetical protein